MNIFIIDYDPVVAARQLCDRHIPKMFLESVQMLSNGLHHYGFANMAKYKPMLVKHPCSKWAIESRDNYEWLIKHACEISNEYTKRFNKIHASNRELNDCIDHYRQFSFKKLNRTKFVQVMPLIYRHPCTVKAYRSYYKDAKTFAKWDKGSAIPKWMNTHKVIYDTNAIKDYIDRGIPLPNSLINSGYPSVNSPVSQTVVDLLNPNISKS